MSDERRPREETSAREERGGEAREEESRLDRVQAHVRLGNWPAWVWIVPATALIFVGWLVIENAVLGGEDILIRFADAEGVTQGTAVRYKGVEVGKVEEVGVSDDLSEVVIRADMKDSMDPALNTGTRFWIVNPSLGSGGLSNLISGAYIGVAPGKGEHTEDFRGLEFVPVLDPPKPGRTFLLAAEGLGSISLGTPIRFEGMRVGEVLGSEYQEDEGRMLIHAFVADRFTDLVRENSRFWRTGGMSVGLTGGKLAVEGASLPSLLTGGIAIHTPEILAGPPADEGQMFQLYGSVDEAEAAPGGPQIAYQIHLPESVGGVHPGAPVELLGVRVGQVRSVRLDYQPATGTFEMPVIVGISPRSLGLEVPPDVTLQQLQGLTNGALQRLIDRGLRARRSGGLIPGSSAITLEILPSPPPAELVVTTEPPTLPSVPGGGGLEGLRSAVDSVSRVAQTIEDLPIRPIARDLRSAARRIDAVVHDPAIDRGLEDLEAALADFRRVADTVQEDAEPVVESLRRAAESAEDVAVQAEQLMGSGVGQGYDVAALIEELQEAAEAVRALASYLTRQPEALVAGRDADE